MNTIKLLLLFVTTLFLSASYSQKMTIGPQVKSSDAGKPWVMKVDNSGIYVSGERLEESKNFSSPQSLIFHWTFYNRANMLENWLGGSSHPLRTGFKLSLLITVFVCDVIYCGIVAALEI